MRKTLITAFALLSSLFLFIGKAEAKSDAAEYRYGPATLQTLDFYPAAQTGKAPLIIYVHGGAWKKGDKVSGLGKYKAPHYNAQGYALASINYRLVPNNTVEDQAHDVAAATAWLHRNAAHLNIDRNRIILMGHSAGAHLVSLVGTDPKYARKKGMPMSAIRGVVALDGAAYDVPAQMRSAGWFMKRNYSQAFGRNPSRQRALSPTSHAAAPNAGSFLILHIERADAKMQAEILSRQLRAAETKVQLNAISGKGMKGHREINQQLGRADYQATPIVDAWLKNIFK